MAFALQDADECIRLAPDFAKGYSRKGHLQFFMKEYEKALETYDTGLKHDPTNSELKEGRQRTMQAVAQVGPGRDNRWWSARLWFCTDAHKISKTALCKIIAATA